MCYKVKSIAMTSLKLQLDRIMRFDMGHFGKKAIDFTTLPVVTADMQLLWTPDGAEMPL